LLLQQTRQRHWVPRARLSLSSTQLKTREDSYSIPPRPCECSSHTRSGRSCPCAVVASSAAAVCCCCCCSRTTGTAAAQTPAAPAGHAGHHTMEPAACRSAERHRGTAADPGRRTRFGRGVGRPGLALPGAAADGPRPAPAAALDGRALRSPDAARLCGSGGVRAAMGGVTGARVPPSRRQPPTRQRGPCARVAVPAALRPRSRQRLHPRRDRPHGHRPRRDAAAQLDARQRGGRACGDGVAPAAGR